jgi:endonuclease VIII
MPEGDTIHRTALTLRRVLAGRTVTAFETPRLRTAAPEPGERIESVEARGKHLLIAFSGGRTLHTHMRMTGSWHTYRTGERWRKPRGSMVVRIATDEAEAVCFSAPVVQVLDAAGLARQPQLRALGPDLCSAEIDLEEILTRLSTLDPATPIGVALLDQRVAAGIGNVYKSETLWACGVDPFAPMDAIAPDTRRELYTTASRQLRANLDTPFERRTVAGGLAVYERAGRPCRRCGTAIECRRQGDQGRNTWWCPACQT